MKLRLCFGSVLIAAILLASQSEGALLFSGTYAQSFDSLANSGTSPTLPDGWSISETLQNADGQYAAGTGSSTGGDTYSFGSAGSTERALGELTSANLASRFGLEIQNNSGQVVVALKISYYGEQWRVGSVSSGRPLDTLQFQYSTDAISLNSGTWNNFSSLDFSSVITTGSVGLLNGNLSANRTFIEATLSGLALANDSTMWIRWIATDASSISDDGLGIDDLSLTAVPEPTNIALTIFVCGLVSAGSIKQWRNSRRTHRIASRA
jgi:hypothetical protein